MKIIVLGSGTTVPHPARASSGFWVETSGGTIMLDLSAPMPYRMAQERLDWPDLDAIWISHFHLDHCGGLAPFLAGTKHAPQMRSRSKPLRVFGPKGTGQLVDRIDAVNNYRLLEQPFPVEIVEVEHGESFEPVPGVAAVACKTPHTAESLAIHLRSAEGTTLVYTSDTAFDEILAAFASGVDLLILESTFLRNRPDIKHLELSEALFLVRKSKCKRAMLTHFYPEWDDTEFLEEIRKIDRKTEILQAADGMRLTLSSVVSCEKPT